MEHLANSNINIELYIEVVSHQSPIDQQGAQPSKNKNTYIYIYSKLFVVYRIKAKAYTNIPTDQKPRGKKHMHRSMLISLYLSISLILRPSAVLWRPFIWSCELRCCFRNQTAKREWQSRECWACCIFSIWVIMNIFII
jgi:hypothetical protein